MSYSLRGRLKNLNYKGLLTDRELNRLVNALDTVDAVEDIKAEIDKAIEKEHKWLMLTRRTLCDIDIAFNGIKSAISKTIKG